MNFISEKWGDLIALALLFLGVIVFLITSDEKVSAVLIGAGLLGLRLKTSNGVKQ